MISPDHDQSHACPPGPVEQDKRQMPNEPSGQKFPTSLNGGSTKEKVHHLTQDHSSRSIDLDLNLFTKEMSEAKRDGPEEKKVVQINQKPEWETFLHDFHLYFGSSIDPAEKCLTQFGR